MAQYISCAPSALSLNGTPLSDWGTLSGVTYLAYPSAQAGLFSAYRLIANTSEHTITSVSASLHLDKGLPTTSYALTTSPNNVEFEITRAFDWPISYGSSVKTEKRTNAKVSNEYGLRGPDGINRKKREWGITITCNKETASDISNFFREHKGLKRFNWQPPTGDFGKWRCDEFSMSVDDFETRTINAKFYEEFV